MAAEDALPMSEEDKMAAEWAAALAESKPSGGSGNEVASEVSGPAETVAPATFANFSPTGVTGAGNDLSMILDIPVQLTVELGRTRIPIKHILQWRRVRWWNWKPWPASRWTCRSTAS